MERVFRPVTGAERARFFQRIFAALIDTVLLVVVFLFGIVPWLGRFAPESLLTLSIISFAYYSIFNSSLGGGATLGKRAMDICVVNRKGDYIGLPRAMLRSAVDVLPTTLGVYIPMLLPAISWPIAETGAAISTAFGLANIYLYIFNWQTRQVLHDLAAGTFVVKADASERPFEARTHAGHVAFAVVLIAAIGFVGTRVRLFHEAVDGPALCAQPITDAVRALPFVERAYVNRRPLTLVKISDPDHTTVMAYVKSDVNYNLARLVARKSISACPALRDERTLKVILIPRQKGYSLRPRLGVFPASVAEWRDSLDYDRRKKAYAAKIANKEGPCTKPILEAVKTLRFAQRVTVTEGVLALPKGHYKEIWVAGPAGERTPALMARDVVRKALKACPAMPDDEVLTVNVRPVPRMAQTFYGSAKEWRARLESNPDE